MRSILCTSTAPENVVYFMLRILAHNLHTAFLYSLDHGGNLQECCFCTRSMIDTGLLCSAPIDQTLLQKRQMKLLLFPVQQLVDKYLHVSQRDKNMRSITRI